MNKIDKQIETRYNEVSDDLKYFDDLFVDVRKELNFDKLIKIRLRLVTKLEKALREKSEIKYRRIEK